MESNLAEPGWTEEQWGRIVSTVSEEAQKGRVAAQALPLSGPEERKTIAIPNYRITLGSSLSVDSDPTLYLSTIAVNVELRTHEVGDPDLNAALVMFRRAANAIARIEDALIFNGRAPNALPAGLAAGITTPPFTVTGSGDPIGIFQGSTRKPPSSGIFQRIVDAITALESDGQLGPYACFLSNDLFKEACDPTPSLVLPRDRILPFLEGPLLRSSAIQEKRGAVVALGGSPVEIVVASDIHVRFLQTTPDGRSLFRVSERVALRVKDLHAIAVL
ncbi:MAG: bacteriocin family protein [Myxococcota bacterium]|nr:bacteriocin family protein [Myxococcota bacterium]